jgi:hypothetical protein
MFRGLQYHRRPHSSLRGYFLKQSKLKEQATVETLHATSLYESNKNLDCFGKYPRNDGGANSLIKCIEPCIIF